MLCSEVRRPWLLRRILENEAISVDPNGVVSLAADHGKPSPYKLQPVGP